MKTVNALFCEKLRSHLAKAVAKLSGTGWRKNARHSPPIDKGTVADRRNPKSIDVDPKQNIPCRRKFFRNGVNLAPVFRYGNGVNVGRRADWNVQ